METKRNGLLGIGILLLGAALGTVSQPAVLSGGTSCAIGTAPVQFLCASDGRPAVGVTPTAFTGGPVSGGAGSLLVSCPLGGLPRCGGLREDG